MGIAAGSRLGRLSTMKNRVTGFHISLGLLLLMPACRRDARLAGRNVPERVDVHAVTHYGRQLDEKASPEEVTYVMMRAILDDFRATAEEQREAALAVQFDICAANIIDSQRSAGLTREEYIYNIVYRWTPTVSHYVDAFDLDFETAKARMKRVHPQRNLTAPADATETTIHMELPDPSGDPNAQVVMIVWLAKDSGFWRVVHPGFDQKLRSISGRRTSAAAP